MFSGQLYNGIKQLIYYWLMWITMLILPTVNLSNIVVTSCLVGDLLCWNAAVIILIFFLNQSHEMSRNIWLVFTPYSHVKVTTFHHKYVLNNIYYISQIPVQHKYSTILSASMNILSNVIHNRKGQYMHICFSKSLMWLLRVRSGEQ